VVRLAYQRVTLPAEPFDLEEKAKSKDKNLSYNPSFSKATRKERVTEMDSFIKAFIKEETTEGGWGK
jgi:hypothetical protein